MSRKCPKCGLVNFAQFADCVRCSTDLAERVNIQPTSGFLKSAMVRRIGVFLFAAMFTVTGFYISLIVSARPISREQNETLQKSILVLEHKGFEKEASLLRHLTVFRSTDNWLNSLIEKENAYAATNFPFEIITLYRDFFEYPADDVERAAILLHESKHLQGYGEKEAYEFVWKNRGRLGWIFANYHSSAVWQNVRKQTREYSPNLFVCDFNNFNDCTEPRTFGIPAKSD
jgi:hypothetical protein